MMKLPEVTQATDVAGVLLHGYFVGIQPKNQKPKNQTQKTDGLASSPIC